jgi:maltooligosyltrehalose trehalohydrolase
VGNCSVVLPSLATSSSIKVAGLVGFGRRALMSTARSPLPSPWTLDLGARLLDPSSVGFRVWAPRARSVGVHIMGGDRPVVSLSPADDGYFEGFAAGVTPGDLYRYVLDGHLERPDPASRSQPQGVHGPSEVIDPGTFRWSDGRWRGLPLDRMIIYELHVGTFTPQGTFDAIIPHLDYLRADLGVTAIELMPVAQFPGARNWGYDGVYPFAPQSSYGGPAGLKRLIDACHAKDLAVILDVVYNHLGPEGNYLADFAPYFTDRYRTPWGQAINYDGPDSDEVRRYVVNNALYWVSEYHVDGLRLDAIHGIFDFGARHILEELAEAVHTQAERLGRIVPVLAESDLNDARVITPVTEGGYGLDGQWSDDFHHALHTVLTGERMGYYEDFGRLDQLATAIREGFVYAGQRSAFRHRRHGNSARRRPPAQLVVSAQNHDQVGNRVRGDRLAATVPHEALKVAAATLLLGPNVPLLFMGEEYAETAPFQYFVSHGDPALVDAVRRGRAEEFVAFGWGGDVPDPQSPDTFERSRLTRNRPRTRQQEVLLSWYRALIDLRVSIPAFGAGLTARHAVWTRESERLVVVHRPGPDGSAALVILGFSPAPTTLTLHEPGGTWRRHLDAGDAVFGGKATLPSLSTVRITSDGVSVQLNGYPAIVFLPA